jgi:hypothetical protein
MRDWKLEQIQTTEDIDLEDLVFFLASGSRDGRLHLGCWSCL